MLIYGYYSITAEKTITGGISKSWCENSPEVTCELNPHHISSVAIEPAFYFCLGWYSCSNEQNFMKLRN